MTLLPAHPTTNEQFTAGWLKSLGWKQYRIAAYTGRSMGWVSYTVRKVLVDHESVFAIRRANGLNLPIQEMPPRDDNAFTVRWYHRLGYNQCEIEDILGVYQGNVSMIVRAKTYRDGPFPEIDSPPDIERAVRLGLPLTASDSVSV